MATDHDVWLAAQRSVAAMFQNWNLSRPYTPSLAKRTEGFTETWGSRQKPSTADDDCWTREQQAVEDICATEYPPQEIVIFQYRPAWTEQLSLRMNEIPHTVVNTSYPTTETSGPLPYLSDLRPNQSPSLMGRFYPYPKSTTHNAILDYLKQTHRVDLDASLADSKELAAKSQLFANLIRKTLEPCLSVLRYQDRNAWEQIYRKRCLNAGSNSRGWKPLAAWQARSERIHSRSSLSPAERDLSADQAIDRARAAYQMLEDKLDEHKKSSRKMFLLGTTRPVSVDVMLWDHLMNALTNIRLVVVLADYPSLCQYVQQLWADYFAGDASANEEWRQWNAKENARNAFNQLPLLSNKRSEEHVSEFKHATELMEQLSVQEHNLYESLVIAKDVRVSQERSIPVSHPFHTWYRWRMGDSLFSSAESSATARGAKHADAASQQEAEMHRIYRRNDELWMACVGIGTVVSILALGFVSVVPGS